MTVRVQSQMENKMQIIQTRAFRQTQNVFCTIFFFSFHFEKSEQQQQKWANDVRS